MMQDSTVSCSACPDGEADDNPLISCDKCGIAVHRDCHGSPLLHLGDNEPWTCERCKWDAQNACCVLCPVKDGAMKRTTDWRFAHLSCALWIPEVFFRNPDAREPIDYLQIPMMRWNLKCCHCKKTQGACMQCSQPGCGQTFHITCGMTHNIFLEYQAKKGGAADVIVAFCSEHAKRWHARKLKSVVRSHKP